MVTEVTTMKVAPVKEFKAHATQYLRGGEPVLITRRGKLVGFFVPVEEPSSLPWDLRRELLQTLTEQLRKKAEEKGLTEEEVLARFEEFRKARRRRQSSDRGAAGRGGR
jgi:antitoxin (DNA-binding transcriptional repressor) of toxin-antitoxin stability system